MDAYVRQGFAIVQGVVAAAEVAEIESELDLIISDVQRHGRQARFGGYMSLSGEAAGRPRVRNFNHPLLMADSALRVAGHPGILRIVAAINGADFIPMNEGCFHKAAFDGAPTTWHQDGRTHWTEEGASMAGVDGSGPTHGLNLSLSISAVAGAGARCERGCAHQW